MNVDKTLNLAIPLKRANGQTIWIHSTPISSEAFNQHFEIIGLTFTAIHGKGYGPLAGPRLAAKIMKKIAVENDIWDGPTGVQGLIDEIQRLTSVLMPRGSETPRMLLSHAVKKGVMTEKEADIVENAVCFFIVASAMHQPEVLAGLLDSMAGMWGCQITSLGSTDFATSLPTLTEIDSSGETPNTLSQAS